MSSEKQNQQETYDTLASLRLQNGSIYVDVTISKQKLALLIVTGATKTFVKKKIVNNPKKLLKSRWQLRTATDDAATVHGEVDVMIGIGATRISHRGLVADIEENVILEMDVMHEHGFGLNLKKRILRIGI